MRVINIGNKIINTYAIKLDEGWLLIDTGYSQQFQSFIKKLSKHKIRISDISYVFLTHAHDDHAGFLDELLKHSDAKVILHKKAVQRLKIGQNSFEGGCTSCLALVFCYMMKLIGKGEHTFPPVNRPDRYIILTDDVQRNIEDELSCKILHLPGHTKDSIGILFDDRSLFCGDGAMNGFPSLSKITIWIENLEEYKESWKTILNNNPMKIYPSHGKPFLKKDLEKNIHKIDSIKLYPLK